MPHTKLKLDLRPITGWGTFHDLFAQLLGLPPTYSRNMNAWMNAIAAIDDPAKPLTTLKVPSGSLLVLELDSIDEFAERCPAQFNALIDCTAMVNLRRIEADADPILVLAFFKN